MSLPVNHGVSVGDLVLVAKGMLGARLAAMAHVDL